MYKLEFEYLFRRAQGVQNVACPICGNVGAKVFQLGPDPYVTGASRRYREISVGHEKYCCTCCRNIFATWLQRDVGEVGEIYSGIGDADSEAHIENERKQMPKEMMRICAALLARDVKGRKAPIRVQRFWLWP